MFNVVQCCNVVSNHKVSHSIYKLSDDFYKRNTCIFALVQLGLIDLIENSGDGRNNNANISRFIECILLQWRLRGMRHSALNCYQITKCIWIYLGFRLCLISFYFYLTCGMTLASWT